MCQSPGADFGSFLGVAIEDLGDRLKLTSQAKSVVVDLGSLVGARTRLADAAALLSFADASLLVVRPCYLALQRALDSALRPTGVVLLTEEGRSLQRTDVESCLGVPVVMEIAVNPLVARAVDAGLLNTRLPRALERAIRRAA